MQKSETPAEVLPVETTPVADVVAEAVAEVPATPPVEVPAVDPVRSAGGRLGAKRRLELVEYGKVYEREHALTPGRQRLRQLIQLGKRYEVEHGLRAAKPRRKLRGDAWAEFLRALAAVVKPAHRPAVVRLAQALNESARAA